MSHAGVAVLPMLLVAGCDAAPVPGRVEPSPPPAAAAPVPVPPRQADAPPAVPRTPDPIVDTKPALQPLAELLPRAPAPITLQHARTLAKPGTWAEAAAVSDALATADPKDTRALAGRGFALASWGDPRVVEHARRDFEAALAMGPERNLAAAIRFNAGSLEEAVGQRERAAAHYREAIALRPSAEASRALERVGGDSKRVFGEGARCELAGPLAATAAGSLPDAITTIRAAQPDAPKTPPPHDADAQALLCGGPCRAGAFVATLGLPDGTTDLEATTEAHVVITNPKTTWVIPRIAIGNGNAARCPDQIHDVEVDEVAGLIRARFTLMSNYFDECFDESVECFSGCIWMSRTDYVVWAVPATGEHVVLSSTLTIDEPSGTDSPWRRLEEEPVLPPGVAHVDEAGVHVRGCGIIRDVALRSPKPSEK